MSVEQVHTLILGAGPAGLAAGFRLAREGMNPVILERSKMTGGLMRGIRRGDFIVDVGRKELYSRIPEVDRLWKEILGSMYRPYEHRIGVLYKGHVIEYSRTYKGVRRGMPWGMFVRGVADLVWGNVNPFKPAPLTSREFMFRKRGEYFGQILSGGFRDKFCGAGWAERPAPDVSRRHRGAPPRSFFERIRGSGFQSEDVQGNKWHHPAGGTGQITRWLEREISSVGGLVYCDASVRRICSSQGRIAEVRAQVENREVSFRPEHVVSSIRIEEMIQLLSGTAAGNDALPKRDGKRGTLAVYLFLNEPPRIPHAYLNVTCPVMKAGRITNYAAFGGEMVPPGKTCLCVEYFCRGTDELFSFSDKRLRDLALEECSSSNLIDPGKCFDYLVLKLPGVDAATSFSTWMEPENQCQLRQLDQFRDLYFVNRPGTDMATFAGLKAAEAILSGERTEFDRLTDPTLDPLFLPDENKEQNELALRVRGRPGKEATDRGRCSRREISFFFENHGAKLFATHHLPPQPGKAKGVVIFSDPWSGEKLCITRTFADLARGISEEGYHAFRFDCRGTGDSEGHLRDVTPASQLSDMRCAIEIFARKGTDRIILLGLRIGGVLAALAAAEDPRIRHLILLDPVTDPASHFEKHYRNEITARALTSLNKDEFTSLRKDLLAREVVDIRGFLLNREAFSQFSEMHLADIIDRFTGNLLTIGIERNPGIRRKKGGNVRTAFAQGNRNHQACIVEGREFWTIGSLERKNHTTQGILDAIRNWLLTLEQYERGKRD